MAGKNKAKKRRRLEREQQQVFLELQANSRRRDKLTARLSKEREALSKLLVAGAAAGLAVGDLAQQAGISRVHAHRLISTAEAARPAAEANAPTDNVNADQTGAPPDTGNGSAPDQEPDQVSPSGPDGPQGS